MPLDTPCDHISTIGDCSNSAIPFVITAFLVLLIVITNHCHHAAKWQVLGQHP